MEYMSKVRDGSNKVIGEGYWTIQVVGVECGGREITPLYHELYSQSALEFISENQEIFKSLERVGAKIKGRGIWMIDRGGDRKNIFNFLLDNEKKFIIRLVGNRDLVYRGKSVLAIELAQSCPMLYTDRVIKEDKGKERVYDIEYGFRKVKLPGRKEDLYLFVLKGFGSAPMMLLTTEEMEKKRQRLHNEILL